MQLQLKHGEIPNSLTHKLKNYRILMKKYPARLGNVVDAVVGERDQDGEAGPGAVHFLVELRVAAVDAERPVPVPIIIPDLS